MIKIAGLFIVLFFSSLAGLAFAEGEKQKRAVCSSLAELFLYISNEIQRHKPVNRIICEFYSKDKKGKIKAKDKNELCKTLKDFAFAGKAGEIVNKAVDFLENLGRSTNANTESESCRAFYRELSAMCGEYMGESVKYSTLYSKLGIMCGIALCILLI